MSVWAGLIERLEKATEGSRELDGEICRVVGIWWSSDEDGNFGGYGIMPRRVRFTESLDAALTLVPEGHAPSLTPTFLGKDHGFRCDIWRLAKHAISPLNCPSVKQTVPLAICIAALKARVSHGVDEPG